METRNAIPDRLAVSDDWTGLDYHTSWVALHHAVPLFSALSACGVEKVVSSSFVCVCVRECESV